ncbi:unnamed protein product [Nesidiocoris tenuis]|uniref:Uncharacterized protein n=1 Tax=Nesidiocoris tenuis TaxID=355587 RepID=A0A6H5HZT5_9HEMI|nr:unnamed protein product [Nesidiocoris tenuis]
MVSVNPRKRGSAKTGIRENRRAYMISGSDPYSEGVNTGHAQDRRRAASIAKWWGTGAAHVPNSRLATSRRYVPVNTRNGNRRLRRRVVQVRLRQAAGRNVLHDGTGVDRLRRELPGRRLRAARPIFALAPPIRSAAGARGRPEGAGAGRLQHGRFPRALRHPGRE